jgi:hypothetical protein
VRPSPQQQQKYIVDVVAKQIWVGGEKHTMHTDTYTYMLIIVRISMLLYKVMKPKSPCALHRFIT